VAVTLTLKGRLVRLAMVGPARAPAASELPSIETNRSSVPATSVSDMTVVLERETAAAGACTRSLSSDASSPPRRCLRVVVHARCVQISAIGVDEHEHAELAVADEGVGDDTDAGSEMTVCLIIVEHSYC
jgi:hypothetical protein